MPSPRQHLIIGKLLKDLNADLYHHPHFDLPFVVKVPSVITIHDLKHIFHSAFLKQKSILKRFYIKTMLNHSIKKAKRIISVGSKTTSMPEVIGNSGLLVDPYNPEDIAEKIKQVYFNSDLANRLSKMGLARAKQFSWQSLAESTIQVYCKAVEN